MHDGDFNFHLSSKSSVDIRQRQINSKKKKLYTLSLRMMIFQPHINLKTRLLDIWYLRSQFKKKSFHANQNCNSPNRNKYSRIINIISYLFFLTHAFPFPLESGKLGLRHTARVLRKALHFHHNILKYHQEGNNTAHKPAMPQCTQAGMLPGILNNCGTNSHFSMGYNLPNYKFEQSAGLLALKISSFNS